MTNVKMMQFSEVCHVYQPETISKKSLPANGVYPVYGANGKIGFNDKFNHEEPQLLLGCRGSVGSIHISEAFSWINGNAMVVQPFEDLVTREYLKYALFGGVNIKDAISGTAQPQITRESLSKVKIPVPSLEEQRDIVKKLDSAFTEIDLLEENLELSDVKANELRQSILGGTFNAYHVGVDLNLVPLKDFCKMYQPPTISTKEMIPDGEFVVYGANGPIGRYNKFNHEEPQLLVTCRGATCGAVNMSEPFSWINGNAMVIQPNLDLATLDYMKYAFLGGIDVSSSITGSAQPQITRTTLEVIKVPLPSLDRQLEIVEKLDFVFTEIEVLRSRLKLKKDFVGALRQSLLSGAFNQEKEVP